MTRFNRASFSMLVKSGLRFRRRMLERAIDVIDKACLRLTIREPTPPRSLRTHVTRLEDFYGTSNEYIAYFKLLGVLKMRDTVLDIGCASGRFAVRLLGAPNYFQGEYHGFDPHRDSIEWAKSHVSCDHSNFNFQTIDLFNGHYNPQGKVDPKTFRFPYKDSQFDFVFAWSVFTHMFSDEMTNYLCEIGRVLKPGKKAIVTFLLLDGYTEKPDWELMKARKMKPAFPGAFSACWHHSEKHSYLYPDAPEAVVAHQESAIRDAAEAADLRVDEIYYGCWNRKEAYLSEQDIVVLSKEAAVAV